MIRCEPDIVRFCDPEAMTNEYKIHTVELSDERSVSQFVTLWFKGQERDLPQLKNWKQEHGLDDHHAREVYHRGSPWIPAMYPGKQKRGWSHHVHVDLNHNPQWSDLQPFLADIPPSIQQDIRQYLEG